jgi:hypothetical protein
MPKTGGKWRILPVKATVRRCDACGGSFKAPTYSKMRADATLKSRVREVVAERAKKCSRIKARKVKKLEAEGERRDRGSLTVYVQGFVVLGTNISRCAAV